VSEHFVMMCERAHGFASARGERDDDYYTTKILNERKNFEACLKQTNFVPQFSPLKTLLPKAALPILMK